MKRFRHIVAATDLSSPSLSAVAYAAHLAKRDGAKLTVVHAPHTTAMAYTEFTPPIDFARIDEAIEQAARKRLERWCDKKLRGVAADVVLRAGVPHEVIRDVAKEVGAGLIVIATHGRKGFARLALGSVAERVLREAPCPVLVVRPKKPEAARSAVRKQAAAA